MAAPKKAPVLDARRDLEKEIAAAGALKYQLKEAFGAGDDVTLLRDMIEGETELEAAIDAVLGQMAMDLANIAGIEKFETTTAARKKRLADRVDAMRSMLLNALDIVEERRLERPLALLTKKPTPAKVIIVDEADIPSQFFKQPDPVLSKTDLLKALKDRRETLDQKIAELAAKVEAGELPADQHQPALERLIAAFPTIPGADLDEGGVTIQVKWS